MIKSGGGFSLEALILEYRTSDSTGPVVQQSTFSALHGTEQLPTSWQETAVNLLILNESFCGSLQVC